MHTKLYPRWLSTHTLVLAGAYPLLSALAGVRANAAAAPPTAATPVIVTNYVFVTNVVVITNYVFTTRTGPATNASALGRTNSALPDLSWVPPEDSFDWIQLNTGEWLKGRIKAMQERQLEFDSEKLKLMTFDWKDIRQLRSPSVQEMGFANRGTVEGPVTITPEQVTIGGEEPRSFARSELYSITPGGTSERNYWSGKVSAGLAVRAGNTKSADYNAQVNLQRRTSGTRLSFDYLGNISRVDSAENANNHRANMEFDYWLSRRLYLILPAGEYFRDPFQNIGRRLTLGGGVGYDLIARPDLEWTISTGPAYQKTWFDSVPAGEAASEGQAALTFGTKFDWEITRRIDLILEYQGQYTSREAGETSHHSVSTLSIDLTKRFDLDVSFVWDRTQNPKENSSGDVPQQNDLRLTLGLGLRF